MTEHILYSFRRCPYAIRARMTLAYTKIECELRELMLKDKPADMLKHSPKGTVPVLISTTGQAIDESFEVMLWALNQKDPDDWLKDLSVSNEFIECNDHEFKPLLDRYKYADRHPTMSEPEHRDLTLGFIANLDQSLTCKKFLIADQIRLADIALFPFIRQYAFVNKAWFDQQPYPHLQHWLNYFLESELFNTVMPKFELFNEGFRYHFPSGRLKSI